MSTSRSGAPLVAAAVAVLVAGCSTAGTAPASTTTALASTATASATPTISASQQYARARAASILGYFQYSDTRANDPRWRKQAKALAAWERKGTAPQPPSAVGSLFDTLSQKEYVEDTATTTSTYKDSDGVTILCTTSTIGAIQVSYILASTQPPVQLISGTAEQPCPASVPPATLYDGGKSPKDTWSVLYFFDALDGLGKVKPAFTPQGSRTYRAARAQVGQ